MESNLRAHVLGMLLERDGLPTDALVKIVSHKNTHQLVHLYFN